MSCHVMFECPITTPALQYAVCFHDCAVTVKPMSANRINHEDWLGPLNQFVAKGWELAGIIDMPVRILKEDSRNANDKCYSSIGNQ